MSAMLVAPSAATAQDPSASSSVGAVRGGARRWLRLEGLAMFAAAAALYGTTGSSWWLFVLLFLVPDLSFGAYLAGPRSGAAAYNVLHSYVGPMVLALLATVAGFAALLPFALIWAAHIGFDRALGYGLKYGSGFGDTHLGRIGR
jgi:hypothetical protein